jgi:hypothetical protein
VIIIVVNLKVILLLEISIQLKRFYSLGPHCKNESQLSIIWQKAIAGQTVIKHCPGHVKNGKRYL